MERGEQPAAFSPPAPLLDSPPGGASSLQESSRLDALVASLAAWACSQEEERGGLESKSLPLPLVVAVGGDVRRGLCSQGGNSLLVLTFFAALVAFVTYLSLLAVGRARR